MTWIIDNLGTIIVSLILAAVISAAIISIIRRKARGQSSCGGICSSCPMGGSCRKEGSCRRERL